jgi:D-psicose/D-tagatose/L-ribulose 3-epimerase
MGLDLKFGASTWLWTSPFNTDSIEPLFSKISRMGFDAVEIAVEDPSVIDFKAVKKALEEYNLQVVLCGAFGTERDLTSADQKFQQNSLQYIKACLDACAELEISFFGGPMYSAVGKARMLPPDQRKKEWELAVTNLRLASEMAAERNLKIALEPLNRFESDLINTVDDVLQLISDIDNPAAGVMLDSFHMGIEERNAEQAIVDAGEKLLHIQVAENYRGTPGTGQTNWDAYKRGLERIGYSGIVSIESFTTENKALAGAVCFWKPMAETQDLFASEGLAFLKKWNHAEHKGLPKSLIL